jgi:hypothetical protein
LPAASGEGDWFQESVTL